MLSQLAFTRTVGAANLLSLGIANGVAVQVKPRHVRWPEGSDRTWLQRTRYVPTANWPAAPSAARCNVMDVRLAKNEGQGEVACKDLQAIKAVAAGFAAEELIARGTEVRDQIAPYLPTSLPLFSRSLAELLLSTRRTKF